MSNSAQHTANLEFGDLENRYGRDIAVSILRVLEQFEGVRVERVRKLPCNERLKNVFRIMKEGMRYQTCH